MIAGRKLLLADDSLAVQKVIDLTFSDEGMEVTTVGDGDAALQKLEQFAPDVILADIFMPGVNGYSLCERIKQHERFGRVPVILLVGSFEPFDEAEARRVGADDVVTKPFQSIRQLVSRVGSLVGGRADDFERNQQLSTLGLQTSEATGGEDGASPPQVTVLVEAPVMTEAESPEVAAKSSTPDIELQTADTQQLPPVSAGVGHAERTSDDAPFVAEERSASTSEINAMNQTTQPTTTEMPEALLDLDETTTTPAAASDDFILDLDTEIVPFDEQVEVPVVAIALEEHLPVAEIIDEQALAKIQESHVEPGSVVTAPVAESAPRTARAVQPVTQQVNVNELSPQIVDAIAQRVVEQLSEKVVREIAWEVVPELAELLIKQRLDEQNR